MRSKIIPFIIAFFLFSTPLILADLNFQNPNLPKLEFIPEVVTFDNNTAYVNASEIWVTNEGLMDNVPDLFPTIDVFVNESGDNMSGNLGFTFDSPTITFGDGGVSETFIFRPSFNPSFGGAEYYFYGNSSGGTLMKMRVLGSSTEMSSNKAMVFESQNGADFTLQAVGGGDIIHNTGDVWFYNGWNTKDNRPTYWGTASDSSINYDGTNMIINPKEVGSGWLEVQGILNMTGNNLIEAKNISSRRLFVEKTGVQGVFEVDDTGTIRFGSTTNHPYYFLQNNNEIALFDSAGDFYLNYQDDQKVWLGGDSDMYLTFDSAGIIRADFSNPDLNFSGWGNINLLNATNIYSNLTFFDPNNGSSTSWARQWYNSTAHYISTGHGKLVSLVSTKIYGHFEQVNGNSTINMIYFEGYGHDEAIAPLGADDVYHNVSNMTKGEINGFGFDGQNLTVQVEGIYKMDSAWSFSGTPNNEYHLSVLVNSVQQNKCHAERVIGSGGDVGSAGFTCLYNLNVGDTLNIAIENVDSAGDPTIHDINWNMVRIGN